MNLKNYYWYFQKALSDEFCDKVIELGKSLQRKKALTGTGKKYTKEVQKIRKSNVAWLNEQWIYKEIQPFIQTAIKILVGIFNGIFLKVVNLLNIKKINFIIGIVIVGIVPIMILKI
jgi:hypothetical protein